MPCPVPNAARCRLIYSGGLLQPDSSAVRPPLMTTRNKANKTAPVQSACAAVGVAEAWRAGKRAVPSARHRAVRPSATKTADIKKGERIARGRQGKLGNWGDKIG